MTAIHTWTAAYDPRTGRELPGGEAASDSDDIERVVAAAAAAAPELEALGRAGRADLLRGLARALDARRDEVVTRADGETALGRKRLAGELDRTVYQLAFFADVIEEGSYVEATIDHTGQTPMGLRPDLRRMLVPLGPVAVFGASNFPLAFSVPGGDTASALAAGNPVVVKAHGSHPGTSRLVFDILRDAVSDAGAPDGTIGILFGREAGERLVRHPAVRAVGFTGSLSGGRALLDAINSREDPIPFYGELSSVNALVVTEDAARERAVEIGAGIVNSVTGSAGQLCTKPGLVLVPAGEGGDALVAAAAAALDSAEVVPLLNQRIQKSYVEDTRQLRARPGVSTVAEGGPVRDGFRVPPLLVTTDAEHAPDAAFAEYFGPAAVIVRYATPTELTAVIRRLPASLTASVHLGKAEVAPPWLDGLRRTAGRLVFNGYPTGVAVSWAQHHGGPWPATNSVFTSVGATAIRRFLRPVTWQDAPAEFLPEELRDAPAHPVPRRVDGVLELAT
ncbi:aldehyde dehydrogenase (NADP(+)) [Kutzneria kofuensis]|uniref:NADP-dependent aldehyde dehydrogenase n=1 Tax=Kutzneria kofuensis TaxID=103725 RepID=A0A7W9KEX5_9PSEU|nr:aldehyde dehydrogenase (NADP(+)) [Kutzneria kofuensis]MBB5891377.1 NADP-dependent aldehyde dehydrogenase [Kutzneria kofuensis]